ncbi:MAG: FtsW/RodA/SpoVE family cell cycle protein [Candidatus Promineifilaceae bacterium]
MTTVNVIRRSNTRVRPAALLQFDHWLALSIGGLALLGLLMVYSTTFDLGLLVQDEPTYYFKRQLGAAALGLVAVLVGLRFDYHILRRFSVPVLLGTLAMLAFVLFFGEAMFGSRRGLFGGSVQPSEVAKLATILYIAHWVSSKGERIKDLTYGLLPFSIILAAVCGLIVRQPDLGTATLIALVGLTLFFVAGADLRQFAMAGALGAAAFMLLITVLPHAPARIDAFRLAWEDPASAGWHTQQFVVALGTGGLFGVGLGEGTQKFGPLPAAHTDGVFAILGEELGLIGCLFAIGLWALFATRGIRTALRARDQYGFLLAAGITCWLSYQALINMAVTTAVVPITGMPLPFLSYGGTSMAMSLAAVGILLNISRDAATRVRVQDPKPMRELMRESLDLRRRNGRPHISRPGRG